MSEQAESADQETTAAGISAESDGAGIVTIAERQATGAAAENSAKETAKEPVRRRSPKSLERSRRRRQLIIACVLGGVFVAVVVLAGFRPTGEAKVLAIAPSVLFEERCHEVADKGSDRLHITDLEVDDAMLAEIVHLDTLETLILDQGVVTDRSMVSISALPRLRHLRLRLSPITDEGLKTIAQCETLWYLNLPHAQCTPEGIAALAQLPRLRQLRLGVPGLGNEVTGAIAKIKSLRGIHLIGIAVTDEGLKTLAAMPSLESLYLDDSAVTEAGWEWLFKNYPQLHVHVNQDHHDRDPKAHVHH